MASLQSNHTTEPATLPTVTWLVKGLDGQHLGTSCFDSIFQFASRIIRWNAEPTFDVDNGHDMMHFSGIGPNCAAQFTTLREWDGNSVLRFGTALDISFKETGGTWTQFCFMPHRDPRNWGVVLVKGYSLFSDKACFPILGHPHPLELGHMRHIISTTGKNGGRDLFNRCFGKAFATLLGLELAIDWKEHRLGPLGTLEEIGQEIMQELPRQRRSHAKSSG